MNLNEWMQAHPDLFSSSPPLPSPLQNMYLITKDVIAESSTASKRIQIPAEAPSGVYTTSLMSLSNLNPIQIRAYNQGKSGTWDLTLSILYQTNLPILQSNGMVSFGGWFYDQNDDSIFLGLEGGVQLGRFPMFVKHVTGTPTDFFRLENGTEEWTPEGYINSVVIQQIA